MKGLSEEIRAQIEFENNMGTKISVTFKRDILMEFKNEPDMPKMLIVEDQFIKANNLKIIRELD